VADTDDRKSAIARHLAEAARALAEARKLSHFEDGDDDGEGIHSALHNAYPRTLPMTDHGSTDIDKLVGDLVAWRWRFLTGESSPPRVGVLEDLTRKVAALDVRAHRTEERLNRVEDNIEWKIER
jgi:hypothetical protein